MLDGDLAQFFFDWISDPNRSLKDPIKKRPCRVAYKIFISFSNPFASFPTMTTTTIKIVVPVIGTAPYLPFLPILPPPKSSSRVLLYRERY